MPDATLSAGLLVTWQRRWEDRTMARMPNEFEVSVDVVAEVEFRVGEKTAAWLVSLGWTPPAEEEKDAAKLLVAEGGVPKRWQCRACMAWRSEEHTSELQSLMRISYAVFCLNK